MKLVIHLSSEGGVPVAVFAVKKPPAPGPDVVVLTAPAGVDEGSYAPTDERLESALRAAGLFGAPSA